MMRLRKKLAFILALALVLIQLPIDQYYAAASSGTGIIVRQFDVSKSTIREGDSFSLSLGFKNNTGRTPVNPMVEINRSESFSLKNSGSKKSIVFKEDGSSEELEFQLVYNGNENTQLPITIHYRLGDENYSIDDYVSIHQAKPKKDKEDKPSETVDKDAIKPNISIVGNKTTMAKAGERVRIPLKIKNTSDSPAYNISASISIEDNSGIFIDGSGFDESSSLSSGDDDSFSYRIEVDRFAEEKTYPIKVSLDYYNKYDRHFTSEDTVYLRVQGDGNDSQLIVDEVSFSPEENIKPGDVVMARFRLRNLSLIPVRDLNLSLDGLSSDGFSLASGTNKTSISLLTGKNTGYVQFPIRVSKKMKGGNQPLKLNIKYKNLRGNNLEEEHEFFIPVVKDSMQNSSLIIENIQGPRIIGANNSAKLSFDLRNRGQSTAMDITAIAELSDTEGLLPTTATTLKENALKPGESKNFSFNFSSTRKSPSKNYPITIKVSYIDNFSGEERYELSQLFIIFVDNPSMDEKGADAKKSKPKLIIDKYSFSENMVEAGQNFEMKLSFYNTNRSKTVHNIKIFLTAEPNVSEGENSPNTGSSVFTPVNSSNTFYIDRIPPKGRVEKSITMFTIPDAAAKTHVITANLEYEDGDFDEYKAEELIGVPVVQQSKLEVGELNYSPTAFMGEEVSISADFYNKGKSTLYNMMVRLEGDFSSENSTNYIGNFAPGNNEFFESSIVPNKEGLLEGKAIFSFEDSTGKEQIIERPFKITVEENLMDDEFPEEPIEKKGFLSKLKIPGLILGLIGLGLGGRKFYKKRKAKKDEEDLLSDE